MLTKEIYRLMKKSRKAESNFDFVVARKYQNIAIELTKKCKHVTESEFKHVFEKAVFTSELLYWMSMHAHDQWGNN